mmetsp:Transcript_102673/g.306649  ORF Transcript_102673/g.306649 Transcript_102673/m.306649 type:complete len:101 (-) Transcript_102673:373-675(-)
MAKGHVAQNMKAASTRLCCRAISIDAFKHMFEQAPKALAISAGINRWNTLGFEGRVAAAILIASERILVNTTPLMVHASPTPNRHRKAGRQQSASRPSTL